jgi:hypothetical protein
MTKKKICPPKFQNKIKNSKKLNFFKINFFFIFRRHLGLSRRFDVLAWQKCFYFYIELELQN